MSVTLLEANKDEAAFLIHIDAKTFEKALIEEYNKAATEEQKKSAPVFLSNEALLGQYPELEKIAGKALDKLMPAYYTNAIKELGLNPITFPKIMPRPGALGQPCVVEVRVSLEPKPELKKFEGLEAAYTPVLVTEEDLAQQIAGLRKQHGAENDDSKLLAKLPFDSIDALKAEIRTSLTSMAEEKTDFYKKEAVMKQLLAANPFTLKNEIIEQQITIEINQLRQQMGAGTLEGYLKSSGRNMGDLRKEVRPQAEANVKRNLLLTAVAERISPEVTEDDIKAAINKQPGSFMDLTADYEKRRKQLEEMPGALEQMKHAIRLEKAAAYVVSKAILHENQPVRIMDELPEYMKLSD